MEDDDRVGNRTPESDAVHQRIREFLEKPYGRRFAVPAVYVPKTAPTSLRHAGCTVRRKVWRSNGYSVRCVTVHVRDTAAIPGALDILFGPPETRVSLDAFVASHVTQVHSLPLVVPRTANAVTVLGRALDEAEPKQWDEVAKGFADELELFCQLTGSLVELVPSTNVSYLAPVNGRRPRQIRIIVNGCPPGEIGARAFITLFKKRIPPEGFQGYGNHPVPGRGRVITDAEENPLLQEIGCNWYVLPPLAQLYDENVSPYVFARILRRAWNGLRVHPAPRPKPVSDEERLKNTEAMVSDLWSDYPRRMRRLLEDAELEVINRQRELMLAYAKRQTYAEILKGIASMDDPARGRALALETLARVQHHPLVRDFLVDGDAFTVRTREVRIRHAGRTYRIGKLTLRVSLRGAVSVWTDRPLHYGRIAHPHVGQDGAPCFGNAAPTILKAVGEMRIADVLEYTLRWLTEGYSPDHTLNPVEGWPLVGESRDQYTRRMIGLPLAGVPEVIDLAAGDPVEAWEPTLVDVRRESGGNGEPPPPPLAQSGEQPQDAAGSPAAE